MYQYIYEESVRRAKHKIWILSDLQQKDPVCARECLDISMSDYESMGAPADMIWYLGDSIEGTNREHLIQMCQMQEQAFDRTGLPLCYVMGNHELDYSRAKEHEQEPVFLPFYEMVKAHEGWHTTPAYTAPYFKISLGDFKVYFFSDHIAKDKSWMSLWGNIQGKEYYPHGELMGQIREEMEQEDGPVITAAHYSFCGGNRASAHLSTLLPLPHQVKIHFYGHAHIGDYAWAKENAYRRIACVDWHDIPQINVSSFEHIRGKFCRSVFLHIYEDHSFGIFFRNHNAREFSEVYFPAKEKQIRGGNFDGL